MMGAADVRRARDSNTAKRYLREDGIDIVIMDWDLEGRTGVALLDYIRNSPESPNRRVPVVMLTANAVENFVLTARDFDATEFLTKPFTAQNLHDRLAAAIARSRAFVDAESYSGPDRRRRQIDFGGPDRRQAAL